MNLAEIQAALREEGLDGWLFFDHHRRDPLAYRVSAVHARIPWCRGAGIISFRRRASRAGWCTRSKRRRWRSCPGEACPRMRSGAKWSTAIRELLGGAKRIAMQYSPNCAVPYVAMVDAGTIELVRGLGVEIATSANLVQYFEARWTQGATRKSSGSRAARRPGAARSVRTDRREAARGRARHGMGHQAVHSRPL